MTENQKSDWISFLNWVNDLSPWNFWKDHNDKSQGLKPHIIDRLNELLSQASQQGREEREREILKILQSWAYQGDEPPHLLLRGLEEKIKGRLIKNMV